MWPERGSVADLQYNIVDMSYPFEHIYLKTDEVYTQIWHLLGHIQSKIVF